MRLTVQFNHQPAFRTVEVGDVWTDAVLPAKFPTVQHGALKMFPQHRLRWSRRIAQFPPPWFLLFAVMNSINHNPPRSTYGATRRIFLTKPPRPRLSKERGHFIDGAATPPWPRRGAVPLPTPTHHSCHSYNSAASHQSQQKTAKNSNAPLRRSMITKKIL